MDTNLRNLRQIVDAIKIKGGRSGLKITEDDIAKKINIPIEKFEVYLSGKEKIPADLQSKLLDAYHLKMTKVSNVEHRQMP